MDTIKIEQARSDYQKIVSFIEDGSPLPPETDPYWEACAALDRLGGFIADIEGAKNTEQPIQPKQKKGKQMTIEIDGNKVTVFDKNCKELDLSGITAIEIRAFAGEPTEAIFTARPDHVTVKDVTRAFMKQLERGE